MGLGSNNSILDDEDVNAPPGSSTLSVHSGSSAEENTSPRSRKARMKKKDETAYAASSCVRLSTKLLEQASENLTLHDESKVRHSIQSSLQDSLLVACAGSQSSSPPTFQAPAPIPYETSDDSSIFPQPVKLVGDAAVGSTSSVKMATPKPRKIVSIVDDDNDIEEPNNTISIFNDDDDIAETASQPALRTTEKPTLVPKANSSDDLAKTPAAKKSSSKPMKTPGGLVIPSPFMYTGKGIFPSTLENYYAKPSVQKSPPRERVNPRNSPTSEKSPRKSTSPGKKSPRKSSTGKEKTNKSPTSRLIASDMVTLSVTASSSSLTERKSPDRLELQRGTSPPSIVRIASSVDDLATVHEASTSKETSNDDDAFLPNDFNKPLVKSPPVEARDSSSTTEAIELAQRELRDELKLEEQILVDVIVSSIEHPAPTTESTQNKDRDVAFEELKVKYERKINEQKDQAALANRVARMRLDEIERLEAQMDAMKERQVDQDELLKLKDRLRQIQQGKKKEVERIRQEMEARMEEQLKQVESSSNHSSDLQRLEQELAEVKKQLAEANAKQMNLEAPTSPTSGEVELLRVKQELADVTEKLALAPTAPPQPELEAELNLVKEELSKVNEKLAVKEKELEDHKNSIPLTKAESPARSPRRLANTGTPPTRSGGKAKRQPGSDGKASKQRDEVTEIYEREKESLRQQIALLDQQASESSREHERALSDLRMASEQEIARIKKEMESRLEHHLDKERELKQTLSEVSSGEKEELLEQIKLLQAEKKMERTGGLREVQKKEDLLQRIAVMEKKEKELIEDHERAIQDLRTQGDFEIQKLRSQMQKQDERRAARERELEQAISETSSFEKEELQRLLESERNGAVLVKIKISNLEKEIEASERNHREAMEALKNSTDAEIERLQNELEERSALEEAMQITSNERDVMAEEVQRLKAMLAEENSQHTRIIEELRKQHGEETAALKNDSAEKIDKLEQDAQNRMQDIQRKADQTCEDLREKCDEKIYILLKQHAEEVEKVNREVQGVEEKYKILLTESNALFESFQKEADAKINELEEELKEKDARFKDELDAVAQRSTVEDKQLREQYEELKAKQIIHESQMKEADDNHNKQFEDLLAQLDLVEAEHQHTISAKEKLLLEKDAIVDALGSQLAEAQRKINEAQHERNQETDQSKQAQQKCHALEEELQLLKSEILDLKDAHKKFAKDAAVAQARACEEAREEMIEKAEIQFQQANEHYVKLRKQYDESQERAKKLESELKSMKKKVERVAKEKESCEIDLKAEVAQLNAAKSKIEADSAQKAKEYRRELERLLQTAKAFEAKADEAGKTSRSIQTTLATVVAEKEKLQKEYEEMKSVSEELMAIVEDREQHEC
jgi:hypothetical protein